VARRPEKVTRRIARRVGPFLLDSKHREVDISDKKKENNLQKGGRGKNKKKQPTVAGDARSRPMR